MRLVVALLFLILQAVGQSIVAEPAKTVQVRSYVRKDGGVHESGTRHGTASRSTAARRAFQAQQPCPSTVSPIGACAGYVVDHVKPLACGGIDAPKNMQWQSIAQAKDEDRWERNDCGQPAVISASHFPQYLRCGYQLLNRRGGNAETIVGTFADRGLVAD
jgi:hypothetical protein